MVFMTELYSSLELEQCISTAQINLHRYPASSKIYGLQDVCFTHLCLITRGCYKRPHLMYSDRDSFNKAQIPITPLASCDAQ